MRNLLNGFLRIWIFPGIFLKLIFERFFYKPIKDSKILIFFLKKVQSDFQILNFFLKILPPH